MANKKEARKARQAERAANGETAPTMTTVTAKTRTAAPKSEAVIAAELALAKAKEEAKAARKAERDARAKEKAEPRPQCTGVKKDGSKCTAKAKAGSDKCIDHQPAWDRLTKEEQDAFTALFESAEPSDLVQELGWHRARQVAKAMAFGHE